MNTRYVVLNIPGLSTTGTLEGGLEMANGPEATPLENSVATCEVKEMTAAEASQIAQKAKAPPVPADLPFELIEPTAASDDATTTSLWGLTAVGALTSKRSGAGVAVAVLDTGCDIDHEAFARLKAEKRIVTKNFTQEGGPDDVSDTNGHGTHCAGTICGATVSGQRIGVAPGIDKLIVGKILGAGGGTNSVIVSAILWAVQQGAKIISMSLGTNFPGWVEVISVQQKMPVRRATSVALKSYRDAITQFGALANFLRTQGVLLVAASGNESERPNFTLDKAPPSASENFVSVAAISQTDATFGVATFSNTGADVCGPGVNVVSAKSGGGLCSKSGTSMATPHVAGIAALWYEELAATNGFVTYDVLRSKLIGKSMQIAGLSPIDVGAGLVQAPA
jgi:subtilisin family serine protease